MTTCEVQPGHRYLMPLGSTASPCGARTEQAVCAEAMPWGREGGWVRRASVMRGAAQAARDGRWDAAIRGKRLADEMLAQFKLNPCAHGTTLKVAT